MSKLLELQEKLDRWDRAYRAGTPEVPDVTYDNNKRVYLGLGGTPYLTRTEAGAIKHATPMGSLAVVESLEALQKRFAGSCGVLVCSAKGDGLAMSVVYRFGKLISAALRTDDGTTGTDVTESAKQFVIPELPARSGDPFFELRGEVVLKVSAWQKHFSDMANPRNAATGIIKRGGADARHLSFLPFDSTTLESASYNWTIGALAGEANDRIASFGLYIVGPPVQPENWDDEVWERVVDGATMLTDEVLADLYAKIKALDYWTDGLVFRVVDNAAYLAAGSVGPDPRLSCAFKFPPESTTTTVTSVDFDVGATGVICPRANLAPVKIAGTVVSYATLHNFENITKLELAVGDTVEIHKAGEIIPQVLRVVKKGDPRFEIAKPEQCPCCGVKTARKMTEDGEGVHLVCPSVLCPAREASRIQRWFKGIDVLGVGEVAAKKLSGIGLYGIYAAADSALLRELVGESAGAQLFRNSHGDGKGRNIPLQEFLENIGIPAVGGNKSVKLANTFLTLEALMAASEADLVKCLGAAGKRVHGYLTQVQDTLPGLAALIQVIPQASAEEKAALPGIAMTGTLSQPRKYFVDRINATGRFQFDDPVKQTTKYLVAADPNGSSSKLAAARRKGITVIGEADLLLLLNT